MYRHPCRCAAWHLSVCAQCCCGVHGWDPAPCTAGMWLSHALLLPEMLLSRSGAHCHELMTWCQPVPTTATRGPGPPWAGPRGLGTHCCGPVLVPQGITGILGSCSAIPQLWGSHGHHHSLPCAGELGTYAAFSRRGNNTCSAPCSAPGRREGSPSPPCLLRCPHQPPALHGWPELQRPMGWHSCSLLLCK